MKRYALLTFLFALSHLATFAQLDKKQLADIKAKQASGEYVWAVGHGSSLRKAREDALSALSSQISTTVSDSFEYLMKSEQTGSKDDFSEQVQNIVKTYSHTTLRNALEIIEKDEPNAVVHRYIKKSDIDKLFEDRKKKALTFARNARDYEAEGKVADALSYYFWAMSLLRSCPDGDKITISFGLDGDKFLHTYIYSCIKEILANIDVRVTSNTLEEDGTRTIGIAATYKSKPATNFNYTIQEEGRRSALHSLQNGEDIISVPSNQNMAKIDMRAEFFCEEELNIDSELKEVMDATDLPPIKPAPVTLKGLKDVKTKKAATVATETATFTETAPSKSSTTPSEDDKKFDTGTAVKYLNADEAKVYLAQMLKIETALRTRNYNSIADCFTPEGKEMFDKLIHYGNARITGKATITFSRLGDEVTCRSLPMSFSFKTNKRTFSEKVVFRFNLEGKVKEVAFGLEDRSTDDILNNGMKKYSSDARQTLVNFLESYKTAYALGRLDYLDKIFAKDAIIITGSIVKSTNIGELAPKNQQHVKYTRQTKEQYLKNLERCIRSNEYINLHFADCKVNKSTGKEIYGIQIKQDYYSSSYGDTGYLFLLIDMTGDMGPLIRVRAWQPDLDDTIMDGRLNLRDFKL